MISASKKVVVEKEDTFFDPRCCTYKLDGMIRNHIDELTKSDSVETEIKSVLVHIMDEDESNKNTLTYDLIVKLHTYLQRADRDYLDPFHKFISQCKCIKPKPRENTILEKRLNLLRLKNSQRFYDSMASNVDKSIENKLDKLADSKNEAASSCNVYSNLNNYDTKSQASEFKKLHGSIVAVFNSFLVFICTFVFCYKALEYSLSQPNIIAQTLFGIGGSTIVAIAELYFLMRVL